jgi:EAL domain-containing protein (putative c-di-GMP-specific phosphodiesterase class I)
MDATLAPETRSQPPAASWSLIRIAQAVALLLAGWLVARRRTPLEVTGSLGIGRSAGLSEDSAPTLLRASLTVYAATPDLPSVHRGRPGKPHLPVTEGLNVLSDLPRALSADEIVLHYQPIVALGDGSIRGAEGLVRWEHPRHGLLGPASFMQVVEQTGLIAPLTRHVLDRAISQCARWRDSGGALSVAVNLSVRNLLDQDLADDVGSLLDRHGLPPDALQLEITESMIMTDPDSSLRTLVELSDLGVELSVDDFGTGYSSLANLRRLPLDQLKIDRSFVTPMLKDESDLIIVRSTINLAHDLGLRIVAEGVEDRPTLIRLASLGADLAQGYHLSRPLPVPAFDDWRRHPVE